MTIEQNKGQAMDQQKERKFLEAIYWGGVLLWAGLVVIAESFGVLPQVAKGDVWSWIFLGAGLYGFLGIYLRVILSQYSSPTWWDYVWSSFVLAVGIGGFYGVDLFWPLVLIIAAIALLGSAFLHRA